MKKPNLFLAIFIFFSLASAKTVAYYGAVAGNANITLEAKNPSELWVKISELTKKYKAITASYNLYTHPTTKKYQITSQLRMDKGQMAEFLAELPALAKVKAQNYYDSSQAYNLPQIQAQLDALDKEIALLGSLIGKLPTISGYALQQRQGLLQQKQQAEASKNITDVNVTLAIQEEGYDAAVNPYLNPQPTSTPLAKPGQQIPLPWAISGGALILLLISTICLLFRRPKKPSVVQS